MPSRRLLRWVSFATLLLALALAPTPASRAVSIPFRGGAEDHYWDVAVVFCRDAVRIAGQEVLHPDNSTGDALPFSLVLSRTLTLLTSPLPIQMVNAVGGPSRNLARVTAAYPYATAQPPGTALNVVIERWEHGESSAVETGGDLSDGDDVETISGTAVNCTAATAPTFDTPPTAPSGGAITVVPGTALQLALQASDADIYDTTIGITADALPNGAALNVTSGNPAQASLTWTPTAQDVGAHPITLRAQDPTGRQSAAYTLTINVGRPVFLPFVSR